MSGGPRVLALGVDEGTLEALGFGHAEALGDGAFAPPGAPDRSGAPTAPDGAPAPLPDGDGWLLVGPAVPAATLGTLVRDAAAHAGRWNLLLVDPSGPSLVPVSAGAPVPPDFVSARLEDAPGVFSLRHALDDLARIRHDLNNPLTAALAETQLLRMDQDDEALATIEVQLQRLRDLIAELAQWRVPR